MLAYTPFRPAAPLALRSRRSRRSAAALRASASPALASAASPVLPSSPSLRADSLQTLAASAAPAAQLACGMQKALLASLSQLVFVLRASPLGLFVAASLARRSASPARGLALSLSLAPLFAHWHDLSTNPTFCATALAWVLAQTLKVFTKWVNTRTWDVRVLFDSGGMPSSHTSLVVGLATSVAVQQGLGSSLFVVCLSFALIVMYDAAGVRRHAGKQAEVLNALVEDYFQGHPVSEQELKEVLGHTPLQVAMGALLGVVTALVYHAKLAV